MCVSLTVLLDVIHDVFHQRRNLVAIDCVCARHLLQRNAKDPSGAGWAPALVAWQRRHALPHGLLLLTTTPPRPHVFEKRNKSRRREIRTQPNAKTSLLIFRVEKHNRQEIQGDDRANKCVRWSQANKNEHSTLKTMGVASSHIVVFFWTLPPHLTKKEEEVEASKGIYTLSFKGRWVERVV